MTSFPSTPPEAPKPETDFETWADNVEPGLSEIERGVAAEAWQAARTALSARLAEVEREWDERTDCLAREIEALRADVITAENALATAQGQLAEADAAISQLHYPSFKDKHWKEALLRHAARAVGKGTESCG